MEIIRDTGTPPSPPQSHRCPSSQTANRFSRSRCTSPLLDPAKSPLSIPVQIVCLVSFLPSPRTCLGEAGRTRKILSAALCDVTIPSVVVSADLAWFPLGATHLRKSLTHSWHMHPQDCRPPLRSNSPTTRQTACSSLEVDGYRTQTAGYAQTDIAASTSAHIRMAVPRSILVIATYLVV